MRDLRFLGEPLLAGAVWAVLALASDALRDQLGAVLLLWAPSGVAVAAFLGTRRSRWAILAAVLLPIQAVAVWLVGTPIDHAFAYSVASLVQSIIAAQLGIMALGGRRSVPRRFRQVGGLFVAAVLGALAGALVAIPFRAEQTLAEFAWWFLANVLGMLTVTPLLLLARQELGLGPKVQQFAFERSLVPFLLGGAVLTEQIFTIPGFGKLIVDAVFTRDYAVVQGVVLCTAAGFILMNLIADVLYFLLNPRMRSAL